MIASKSDGIAAPSSSPRHLLTNPFSLAEDGFFAPLLQLLARKRGVEGGGGEEDKFGAEWCEKGESGVKWGIERGIHAHILGKVVKINVLGHS